MAVTFDEILALDAPPPSAVIRYGSDPQQRGELWLPGGNVQGLVVFIHGGCWLNEYAVGHSRPLCSELAERGLAVYSLEYRRIGDPGGGFPGTFEDIMLALDTVDLLREWDVDTAHPLLVGHSAGGHLALWAAATRPNSVSGVVGLAAIADLERYAEGESACERATVQLLGGTAAAVPDRYERFSPRRMRLHARTFLVHGAEDDVVPISQAGSLDLDPGRLVTVDCGHFELIHPGNPAFETVHATIWRALR